MSVDSIALETPKPGRWLVWAPTFFVVCGLIVRVAHYLANHDIWHDEAMLLVNILDKSFLELLGPLTNTQAGPPLWLWTMKAVSVVFGVNSYAWRFLPFVFGCGTLILIARLTKRVVPNPAAAAIVIGLVAFSDSFLRLDCCIKPYASDAFLGAMLCLIYLRTESWTLERRLLLFALVAAPILCFSLVALFVYGGVMLAILPALVRSRRWTAWGSFGILAAVTLATLVVLELGPIRAQKTPLLVSLWANRFAPLDRPLAIPGWIVGNSFLVFHYLFNPVGVVLLPVTVVASVWCLRNRRWEQFCLFVGPISAVLAASFVKAYPFGGSRLILFAGPGLAAMSAIGLSLVLDRMRQLTLRPEPILAALLLLPELGFCAYRLREPWEKLDGPSLHAYIAANRQGDDLVFADPHCLYHVRDQVVSPEAIRAAARPGQRVWVGITFCANRPQDGLAEFAATIGDGSHWRIDRHVVFRGVAVLLVTRDSSDPSTSAESR